MSSDHPGSHRGLSARRFEIVVVAALDEERVIGNRGSLPWRLPADQRYFKEVTMGHPLLMGRRTYESIGRPLPGRRNIVLSRNENFDAPGCEIASGIDEALSIVEDAAARRAMVIGGQYLYRQLLPFADRMLLTVVRGSHPGDTFFPSFDDDQWQIDDHRYRRRDEDNDRDMVFVSLRALAPPPRTVDDEPTRGPLPESLSHVLPWNR